MDDETGAEPNVLHAVPFFSVANIEESVRHYVDLDFVMTSEREWGCYRTLPGIAIYHLSTRPGIDAIGLTRWVWNGRQRTLNQNLTGTDAIAGMVAVSDK